MKRTDDDALEELEREIRASQFEPWDVEEYLARRHRAKIDVLTAPESRPRRLQVAKELFGALLMFIGYITVMTVITFWAMTGEFPLRTHLSEEPELIIPGPGPPLDAN